MGKELTPEHSSQQHQLQAILNSDSAGYFNNITALAASLCSKSFAAILMPSGSLLICSANFGFADSRFLQPFPLREDQAIYDDIQPAAADFEINGKAILCLASVKIPVDGQDAPLWLGVMDHQSSVLSGQELTQLHMLAMQAGAIINLSTQALASSSTKQVDEKLREQKTFYEKILNKIPSDIAVFDADHRYLFVNPGAISIPELREYIIGKDDYEYLAYRNRDISMAHARRAKFLEVKKTGKEARWDEDITRPDGTVATILRYMFPVVEDNGEVRLVIGYGIDISNRKALEEKQGGLVKQLSLQNTQLIDFCNIVSHNLRAPLVNMSMLVDLIKETDDPEEHHILVDKLAPVIKNLHATLNELVESIQVKQDIEVEAEDMSLEDVLKRTLKGLGSELEENDAEIQYDFSEAPVVHFPPKYLYSIFHNFLSNSSKYRSPGRRLAVGIKSRRDNNKIILSFTDNGLGIDLVKHGQKLFKIGKVFHDRADAKGFGLYMTKTQVEAMNGRIWAESTPGEGTTFYIEFVNQGI